MSCSVRAVCSRAAFGLTLLSGAIALADEAPTRPEQHESDALPPSRVRLPLILGGLAFSAGVWGLNTGTSYLYPNAPGLPQLRVPIVGPWMALAHNNCNDAAILGQSCGAFYYVNAIYFVLSGIAQASGLGVALEGILVPTGQNTGSPKAPRPAPSSPPDEGP